MRTSTAGIMAIASHEGIVLSPYLDSVGVWTLGVGHTAAAGFPDPKTFKGSLTLGEAIGLFRHDLLKYEAAVNKALKVEVKQHEFDAIVSWHYNTGAVATASWIKKLNTGDRAGALKGIMDWRKPVEIIPRRTAERDLFKTGKYPAPIAMIYPSVSGKVQWKQGKRVDLTLAMASSSELGPAIAGAQPAPAPPMPGPPALGAPIPGAGQPAKPGPRPGTSYDGLEVHDPSIPSLWATFINLILKLFRKGA